MLRASTAPMDDAPVWLLDLLKPKPVKPRPERKASVSHDAAETEKMAQAAIDALDPWRRDNYETWTQVGFSLFSLGSVGLSLWDTWSAGSEKYRAGECDRKWTTFDIGGIGIGSLFKWADDDAGPSWRPYKPPDIDVDEHLNVISAIADEPEKDKAYWPNGLPIGLRSGMNRNAPPNATLMLELLNEAMMAGLMTADDPVDVKFMECVSEVLKRGVGTASIRAGLKHGLGLFLVNASHYIIPIRESREDQNAQVSCTNPLGAGRHVNLYKLLPRSEILSNVAKLEIKPILQKHFPLEDDIVAPLHTALLEELGKDTAEAERLKGELETRYGELIASQPGFKSALYRARLEYRRFLRLMTTEQGVPIPADWIYPKASEYVACCARALLVSSGGNMQLGRCELAWRIGCACSNLNVVLRRANIHWEKDQFSYKPIASSEQIATIENRYDVEMAGFPVAYTSTGRESVIPFADADCRAWIDKELELKATVSLRYWQANKQVADDGPQPCTIKPLLPRLTYAGIVYLRRLLSYIARCVTPIQPELLPEEEVSQPVVFTQPIIVTHFIRRLNSFRVLCICVLLSFMRQSLMANAPYGEKQMRKLLEKATPWRVRHAELVDTESGEIQPYDVQLPLDLLLSEANDEMVQETSIPTTPTEKLVTTAAHLDGNSTGSTPELPDSGRVHSSTGTSKHSTGAGTDQADHGWIQPVDCAVPYAPTPDVYWDSMENVMQLMGVK